MLPEGAPRITCTLSTPLLADGTEGFITSANLSIDRDLVWVDTGETLYKEPTAQVVENIGEDAGTLMFEVIPVDVDGMREVSGTGIRMWAYLLHVEIMFPNGLLRSVEYVFQPTMADIELGFDLDLAPQSGVDSLPPLPQINFIDGGTP